MKKILLTGASGFLGKYVSLHKPSDWQLIGVYHKNRPANLAQVVQADLSQASHVEQLFQRDSYDGLIHLAAISNAHYCQQHQQASFAINVSATRHLAELCAKRDIPLVFTSTDLVFDGKQGNYTEEDVVNPLSIYGEQKALAEEAVREVYPQAAICRMPLMFGWGGSFMPGFLEKMKAGESLNLFTDEYRSILGGHSAAKGLIQALFNFKGLYHLGGPETVDRYTFGKWMQGAFPGPKAQLVPTLQAELELLAPRPANVSLDSSKAYGQGFEPMSPKKELDLIASDLP